MRRHNFESEAFGISALVGEFVVVVKEVAVLRRKRLEDADTDLVQVLRSNYNISFLLKRLVQLGEITCLCLVNVIS